MKLQRKVCVLLLAVFMAAPCYAKDAVLWQVGKPDDSYAEFAMAGKYEQYREVFGGGSMFEVGKSVPSKDWCYVHPGPAETWAGEGEHPFEVIFNLDTVPKGPFVVRVDLVDVSPGEITSLRVRVNDKACVYDLKTGRSEASLRTPGKGRKQTVELYVGTGHLHEGRNVVNLAVIRGGWVVYDCVTMKQVATVPHIAQALSFRPTCLFKKRDGQLNQVVIGSVDICDSAAKVRVDLRGDKGLRVSQTFTSLPSGHVNLEVDIPVLKAAEMVTMTLTTSKEKLETKGLVTPQKQWRIYMLPTTHMDIGYTVIQNEALQVHLDDVTRAMEWSKRYPSFVWDTEGSLVADEYFRQGKNREEFIAALRSGTIGVMGLYSNELTGYCSGESLTRSVEYYDYLRKTYGAETKCAMLTDVPTMVSTVPMILAGHGIKYLSHGINATRAFGNQEPLDYPFYWESPDGSRVLMWKTGGYGQSAGVTGGDDGGSLPRAMDGISSTLQHYSEREDYPFDAILLHGGYGDNEGNMKSIAEVPERWNQIYEYPKLIPCQGKEFFEYIEARFPEDIKTLKGDGGVFWEDGVGSSARETAITRVARERLVTAEKMISLCTSQTRQDMRDRLTEAWRNVFYYEEHTWGADVSVQHPASDKTLALWAVKKAFADKAAEMADSILRDAAQQLATQVGAGEGIFVFNPSSWTRTEWVTCAMTDGKSVCLRAENVPPMGYKIVSATDDNPPIGATDGSVLDNHWYTVTFDEATGAITSIYDKDLDRELVDSSTYGLGAYLYATAEHDNSLLGPGEIAPIGLTVETVGKAMLAKSVSPGSQTMEIDGEAPMAKSYKARVVLHNDQKRIDFICEIDRIANLNKEGGYFAFPFAFKNPDIRIEIPYGVVRADIDHFKGACRDWFCTQQFVTISDASAAVVWTPVDTPLLTLQDINRGQWYDRLKIENGNVFAYAFNNYWWTNYKASQEGPHTFHFAMTSAKSFTDSQAKRFGEAVCNPLVAVAAPGAAKAGSPAEQSFVTVDDDSVIVQAMTPARFADGTVIRLREMNGETGKARVTVNGIAFKQAYLCNLAEDKLQRLDSKGGVEVTCPALGLTTVLLER